MRRLRTTGLTVGQSIILIKCSLHQRRVLMQYRMDGASATAPASSVSAGMAHLDGLALTQLACPSGILEVEPLQSLTRLAATNQPCQVLEAISRTALILNDAALATSRGTSSPHSAGIGMQALFQNGYDTLVALLQALPQCSSAYGPAAVIPETCVKLFHVHNLLLQAAYASNQDFDVWTELMQAGVELYLRKAPRHIVTFSNAHLDAILDAVAHQDLWRFQRLLWQRLLPQISTWNSLQDLCSVIQECELAAQAATTAAAAAAAVVSGVPLGGGSMSGPSGPPHAAELPSSGWPSSTSTALEEILPSSGALSFPWAPGPTEQSDVTPRYPETASIQPPRLSSSPEPHYAGALAPCYVDMRTADALYDKQTELAEYGILMSDCIRAALEGASSRGLAFEPQPHVAALQLLEVVTAFDARQRRPGALTALRYAFIPSPDWLSRVVVAGIQAGERLSAAQVVKLLQDLDALAPSPPEGHSTATYRWLNAAGQAAVENAVVYNLSVGVWSPQQAISLIKALAGKCSGVPGDAMCLLVEGLLLGCNEARQDLGLLCAVLQEAVDLAPSSCGGDKENAFASIPALTAAHLALVKVALNRASYLVDSNAPGTDGGGASTSATPSLSESGRVVSARSMWRSREFLFDRYPRILQAARRFGYPLQAFRLEEYAEELYTHLATSPGHELVAVGPEGLALVLQAVSSSPCCMDPQWAAAFERACLTLVSVQFSVGYTHPKRWLGLLEATVTALPFPMPVLAAGIKALLVRLCDTRRHAKYFWQLLPLVGTLERRAAAVASMRGHQHHAGAQSSSQQGSAPAWTPIASTARSPTLTFSSSNGKLRKGSGRATSPPRGTHRRVSPSRSLASTIAVVKGKGSPSTSYGSGTVSSVPRTVLPPPDISKHHVSEEEYTRWSEDLGRRLALSMACLSDEDRVAQLSVLGIGAAGPS